MVPDDDARPCIDPEGYWDIGRESPHSLISLISAAIYRIQSDPERANYEQFLNWLRQPMNYFIKTKDHPTKEDFHEAQNQ